MSAPGVCLRQSYYDSTLASHSSGEDETQKVEEEMGAGLPAPILMALGNHSGGEPRDDLGENDHQQQGNDDEPHVGDYAADDVCRIDALLGLRYGLQEENGVGKRRAQE